MRDRGIRARLVAAGVGAKAEYIQYANLRTALAATTRITNPIDHESGDAPQ